jgi:hypothetical protein
MAEGETPMKRNVTIVANDGDTHIEITARIMPRSPLTRDEVNRVAVEIGRSIADGLRDVSYTSFGPENTQIQM